MIYGCYNLNGGTNPPPAYMSSESTGGDLRFFPVGADGFAGGFFLHDRLPLRQRDIYYRDAGTDLLILFSGYIYNRKEIADCYQLDTDAPEPLIAARMFLLVGPDFVSKLNGDFAIFICRPAQRRAYLFRDHIGVRPMAWSIREETMFFSTDVRELSRFMATGRGPDLSWLTGQFRYIDHSDTPCSEVQKLLPGHYLEFSGEGARMKRYWDPGKIRTERHMTHDTMVSELRQLLADAVSIRCDSRFSAGAHVSGGLDSGAVAGLVRMEYAAQSSFFGYSWSPAEFTV